MAELQTQTNQQKKGIRNIIVQKQLGSHAKEMVVLIKPTDKSSYGNVVDVLDEMTINSVKTYMLMDADAKEKQVSGNLLN